jgi:hypothetical protein
MMFMVRARAYKVQKRRKLRELNGGDGEMEALVYVYHNTVNIAY